MAASYHLILTPGPGTQRPYPNSMAPVRTPHPNTRVAPKCFSEAVWAAIENLIRAPGPPYENPLSYLTGLPTNTLS
eukprot:9479125-Pyramimonas_sp.AAC.2